MAYILRIKGTGKIYINTNGEWVTDIHEAMEFDDKSNAEDYARMHEEDHQMRSYTIAVEWKN